MFPYNAQAEKEIVNLTEICEDFEENVINLIEAKEILDRSFKGHPSDSIENTKDRLEAKLKAYDSILRAYERLNEEFPDIDKYKKQIEDLKKI